MEQKRGNFDCGNQSGQIVRAKVVEHLFCDIPGDSPDGDFADTQFFDVRVALGKQVREVLGITGGGQGDQGFDVGIIVVLSSMSQGDCSPETVPDQSCHSPQFIIRESDGGRQISLIAAEIGFSKVAPTASQSGHVVTQNVDPEVG